MALVEFSSSFASCPTFSAFFCLLSAMILAFSCQPLAAGEENSAGPRGPRLPLRLPAARSWRPGAESSGLGGAVCHSRIERNAGAHRRADRDALDVLSLGCRRLGPNHAADDRHRVFDELLGRKGDLAHRDVHECRLVGAE